MTAQTRAVLKAAFETGDIPDGDDYANLVDSFVSLSDTTAQSLSSNLEVITLIATTVSAGSVSADLVRSTTVSGGTGAFDSMTVGGNVVTGVAGVAKAEIFLEATATTSIGSMGTYELLGGTFSADSTLLTNFSAKTTGELVYQGSVETTILFTLFLSIAAQSATTMTALRIGKNGTTLTKSQMNRFISSADQAGAAATGGFVEVSAGDTLGFYIANLTDSSNFDVHNAIMTAVEVG